MSVILLAGIALASVLVISGISLIGLFTLRWDESVVEARLPVIVAVAAGVLVGESIFHLIPESIRVGVPILAVGTLVAVGALISYMIEFSCRRFLKNASVAPVARVSLIAESIHNGIDGSIVAAAYLVGLKVGLFATLAVAMHELPHELGNFAVLVDAGYPRKRALKLNFASGCAAIFGAMIVVIAGPVTGRFAALVLPVAAGCFIYMSLIDLLPNLWRRSGGVGLAPIGCGLTAGIVFMLVLTRAK